MPGSRDAGCPLGLNSRLRGPLLVLPLSKGPQALLALADANEVRRVRKCRINRRTVLLRTRRYAAFAETSLDLRSPHRSPLLSEESSCGVEGAQPLIRPRPYAIPHDGPFRG